YVYNGKTFYITGGLNPDTNQYVDVFTIPAEKIIGYAEISENSISGTQSLEQQGVLIYVPAHASTNQFDLLYDALIESEQGIKNWMQKVNDVSKEELLHALTERMITLCKDDYVGLSNYKKLEEMRGNQLKFCRDFILKYIFPERSTGLPTCSAELFIKMFDKIFGREISSNKLKEISGDLSMTYKKMFTLIEILLCSENLYTLDTIIHELNIEVDSLNEIINEIWGEESGIINYDQLLKKQKIGAFKNFLNEENIGEKSSRAFILPLKVRFSEDNLIKFEFDNENRKFAKDLNTQDKQSEYLNEINQFLDENSFLIKYKIRSYEGELRPEIIINNQQKEMIKAQILNILDKTNLLDRFKGITSECFDDAKNYFKNSKDYKGVYQYLGDNLFDTILNHYVEFEFIAQIWGNFYSQYSKEITDDLPNINSLKDKYLINWKQQQNLNLQCLIWGLLTDFRHPLTSQRFEKINNEGKIVPDFNTWMGFALHHWKTTGGHENKFECFWSAVFPMPKSRNVGSPVHNDITNNVEKYGEEWEKVINNAINSLLNGQIPNFENIDRTFLKKFNIGWNDENINEKFDDYLEENENLIELLKKLLYF
ncbi:MAG: hypothetical protein ACFFG0_27510, partial [Candidatus Thorarchaeota archaeon]